ncbi:MAG TPA: hypothetical protein VFU81_19665 [Thermomicrobiales bacterium]|nr:hypothetical protein [Thermomicrobiales bacterium]
MGVRATALTACEWPRNTLGEGAAAGGCAEADAAAESMAIAENHGQNLLPSERVGTRGVGFIGEWRRPAGMAVS